MMSADRPIIPSDSSLRLYKQSLPRQAIYIKVNSPDIIRTCLPKLGLGGLQYG